MSLFASLSNVGRAVAYYPRLAHFFGSVNAAILFAQLHYWDGRSESPLGTYKTADELSLETGLSYREQATARAILRDAGYLIETHRRLEHRVYFKLDAAVIDAAYEAWTKAQSPNDENAFREMPKAQSGEVAKRRSGAAKTSSVELRKAQSDKSTESTHQITSIKAASTETIPGVPEELVTEWKAVRKAKKAGPIGKTVIDALHREAAKAGVTVETAVRLAVERGWQGFKADWLAGQGVGRGGAPHKHAGAHTAIFQGVNAL